MEPRNLKMKLGVLGHLLLDGQFKVSGHLALMEKILMMLIELLKLVNLKVKL